MTPSKSRVEADLEAALPDRLGQALRDVETVERNDAARFRAHPEDFRVGALSAIGKTPEA